MTTTEVLSMAAEISVDGEDVLKRRRTVSPIQ